MVLAPLALSYALAVFESKYPRTKEVNSKKLLVDFYNFAFSYSVISTTTYISLKYNCFLNRVKIV